MVTEGVQHGQVGCRLEVEHLSEGLIPIFQNRLEDLQSGHHPAGAVNEIRVGVAKLAQQIGGELLSRVDMLNRAAVLQIFLITALNPRGETFDAESLAGFAQFMPRRPLRGYGWLAPSWMVFV